VASMRSAYNDAERERAGTDTAAVAVVAPATGDLALRLGDEAGLGARDSNNMARSFSCSVSNVLVSASFLPRCERASEHAPVAGATSLVTRATRSATVSECSTANASVLPSRVRTSTCMWRHQSSERRSAIALTYCYPTSGVGISEIDRRKTITSGEQQYH